MLPDNRNKKGTGFTNLNRVLQANQGNRLGSSVAGGVKTLGQDVRTQTQQAQSSFEQEAQKNRLDTEQAKQERSNIIGRFNQPSGTKSSGQAPAETQMTTKPVAEAGLATSSGVDRSGQPNAPVQSSGFTPVTDEEVNKFTRFRTGTYAGPKQLENFDQLSGKAMEAEQVGGLTRSSGGRQELLRRFVGGRDYTQGEQRLDTALLGLTGQEGLSEARRATRGLGMDVAQANQTAAGLAQEYANRAKIFGQETVGQLQGARDPISQAIEDRLKGYQATEQQRSQDYQEIQNILAGKGDEYKGLDKFTRLGVALQDLSDRGYIDQATQQKLLGERGLISRAEAIGLDTNKLIGERIRDIKAQGLTRAGAANAEEEAKISSLDRLLGKVGTDVEFGAAGDEYKAGGFGFDAGSLEDYITKSENEKAQRDSAYAEKLAAERARYMSQAAAGAMQGAGGVMQAAGGGLEAILSPMAGLNQPQALLSGNANMIGGMTDATTGFMTANQQGQNALLEGLTKLNIGGQSIANTEGGKQLLKLIELKSKAENLGIGNANMAGQTAATGLRDLAAGDLRGALGNLTGANTAQNLLRQIKGGDIGNALRRVSGGVGGAVRSAGRTLSRVCFAPNTEILMEDGKYKKIKDIQVGEKVALGGRVLTIGEGISDELYQYGNVQVTANHALYENGRWIRVKDSEKAYPLGEDEQIIYPIGTETHLLVTRGQIWADVFEIEDYDSKDLEYNLNVLNENKPRNRKLDRFLKEYFEDDKSTLEKIKTPF